MDPARADPRHRARRPARAAPRGAAVRVVGARARIEIVHPHVVVDVDASRAKVPAMKGAEIDRLASFAIVDGTLDFAIDTASGRSALRLADVQVELEATE